MFSDRLERFSGGLESFLMALKVSRCPGKLSNYLESFQMVRKVSRWSGQFFPNLASFHIAKASFHMGSFPQDGENEQNLSYFFSLELYCDQTVLFFQVFSIVLKRLCPLQSKNTFVLVPAIFLIFKKAIFLAQNLIFWQSLTLSCDQTVRAGLDLTFS